MLLRLAQLAARLLKQAEVVEDDRLAPAILDLAGQGECLGIMAERRRVIAHQVSRLAAIAETLDGERLIADLQRDAVRPAMEFSRPGMVALERRDRAQIVQRAGKAGTVVQAFRQAPRVVEDQAGLCRIPTRQRVVPFIAEIPDLRGQRGQLGSRGAAGTAARHERKRQDDRRNPSHSLTTSSARKLLGAVAARSSARAARPLAANAETGKVLFAPATTSPTSSAVPCTDRTSGGTSW